MKTVLKIEYFKTGELKMSRTSTCLTSVLLYCSLPESQCNRIIYFLLNYFNQKITDKLKPITELDDKVKECQNFHQTGFPAEWHTN